MVEPFSPGEAAALRDLLLRQQTPDESDFLRVASRPVSELRHIVRQSASLLRDPSVPLDELVSLLNKSVSPKRRISVCLPPRLNLEVVSLGPATLPPKIRGKTRVMTAPPSPNLRVPILPRIASALPPRQTPAPVIGSLAAVLHPQLGPVHVCRVLARQMQNDTDHFLVAFFQSDHSPCLVPGAYLFELRPRLGFPLGDDAEFARCLDRQDVSVDWLLERIFIAAQVLAIDHAALLYPVQQIKEGGVRPTPLQIQQRMFQCVSCAALLIVCYIAVRWKIPEAKLGMIVGAILRTNLSRFTSTQNIMAHVERMLVSLLALRGKQR
jgi:hypothetical protein